MNRVEFMAQLERLLYDLPEAEKQDALCYYNDYFDDAGEENESRVIQELGSPGKVAAIIRPDYKSGGSGDGSGEYTEKGYHDTRFSDNGQMPAKKGEFGQSADTSFEKKPYSRRQDTSRHAYGQDWRSGGHRRRGAGGWILIVLALIFVGPVLLGFGGAAIGLFAGLCGAALAFLFSGFALAASGVVGIVKGFFLAMSTPGVGLVAIGGGLLLLAAGLVLVVLFTWVLCRFLPRAFRAVINFLSRIFHHGRGQDQGGEQS